MVRCGPYFSDSLLALVCALHTYGKPLKRLTGLPHVTMLTGLPHVTMLTGLPHFTKRSLLFSESSILCFNANIPKFHSEYDLLSTRAVHIHRIDIRHNSDQNNQGFKEITLCTRKMGLAWLTREFP